MLLLWRSLTLTRNSNVGFILALMEGGGEDLILT